MHLLRQHSQRLASGTLAIGRLLATHLGHVAKSAPTHGCCDYAQHDDRRHSRSGYGTQTSSFPKYPPNPNFVIPEVPAKPKLRHSRSTRRTQTSSFARSRGIHLRLPMHQPDKPAPSAPKHGYCDFAQYDGACHSAPLPSFPKYPPNPNFVIPRAVAESIFACQCISQISQCPLHPSMDTATSRSKTVLVIPRPSRHPEVPAKPKLRHSRSTHQTQTSSFPKYPPNPNFVIPRAVAESISPANASAR